jgi:uncharacterized protein involved in exopolysaccharide biosynthesis
MSAAGTHLHNRLTRRWYLTVLGLLGTVALCMLAASLAPVGYRAQANLLLTPPASGARAANGTDVSLSALRPLADAEGQAMTARGTDARLRGEGLVGSYAVVRDGASNAPILDATADASSSSAALTDLHLVVSTADPTLSSMQGRNAVSASDRVTVQVITLPSRAESYVKSRWVERGLILAAALLGLIATALVVSAIDELLLRRRRSTAEV